MNNFNKHSFVLTTNGYKNIQFITPQDYLYTSNNTIDKVCNTNNFKISEISKYSYLQNSIDDLNYLISNESLVEVYDQSYKRYAKEVSLLSKNDWLFHPWVIKETSNIRSKVDLLKTQEFFHDSDYIYLFNNKLFDMSKALQISLRALKQTLICEDKDFEHHLPEIIAYIKNEYNIDYDNTENGFKNFKTFVKNTFVFKMKRHIDIDKKYVSFVISALKNCKLSVKQFESGGKSYLIEMSYHSEADKELIKQTQMFLKNVNVKFSVNINTNNKQTYIKIVNKPLYFFINETLNKDISSVVNSSDELQKYFITSLYPDLRTQIITSLNVALQLKELFLYHKEILAIKQHSQFYKVIKLKDDLELLDTTLVVEQDGYYSKVVTKLPLESLYTPFKEVYVKDKKIIHLGFTECRL